MGAGREMSYHAARALLADEASSNAAGMGLVNVSIEESYQVNEDAFHDRIIKVRNPGQPNVCASDGARVFPLTDFSRTRPPDANSRSPLPFQNPSFHPNQYAGGHRG